MPFSVTSFQATPNPNALKCVLDRAVTDRPRSYRSADEAASDPLAAALFRVAGVTNLLFNDGWVTVNKAPEADWAGIRAGVKRALAGGPEGE